MQPAIRLVNVTQHYGVRPILKGVDWEIARGLVVALMGPNGSGKSTLLGTVAGVLSPIKGYIEIDGRRRKESIEAELAIRQEVFYLPDQAWLPSARTGREYVLAVGRLYGVDDERLFDHAERLLKVFDLEPLADSPIGSYSAGQRKKIALSAALVCETPILILDEPFSGGLDPPGLFALKELLHRLAKRDDVTVLMSTPVPEIVVEIAERIAILRDGRIAAYDTPEGLRQLSGTDGPIEKALERIVNPQTADNIRQYFEGRDQ